MGCPQRQVVGCGRGSTQRNARRHLIAGLIGGVVAAESAAKPVLLLVVVRLDLAVRQRVVCRHKEPVHYRRGHEHCAVRTLLPDAFSLLLGARCWCKRMYCNEMRTVCCCERHEDGLLLEKDAWSD